jgi:regulator of sigma E protease
MFSNVSLDDYIEQHGAVPLTLKVQRKNKLFEVALTPQIPIGATNNKPAHGIEWDYSGGKMAIAHPGVGEQIAGGVDAMVSTFGALFSRKSDIKLQHLSGAVKIINIYYVLFQSEHGWRLALWFSVIMNVNLALLNLLPIPVLDGGHIVLALVEAIRRKPVSARILNVLQTACAVIIIGYMIYIAWFDVQDSSWRVPKERPAQDIRFEPEKPPPTPPASVLPP